MMLDTMFQHPGTVQCALFEWLGFRELYLFKETTPYFFGQDACSLSRINCFIIS